MAAVCPECGSTRYVKNGFVIVDRKDVQRYLCRGCKRSFTHFKRTGKRRPKFNDMEPDTTVENNDGE